DVDVVACKRRDTNSDAFSQGSFTKIRTPWPHRNGHTDRVVTVVDTHLTIAQVNQWANVALTHIVDLHGVDNGTPHVILRPGHFHASDMRRMKQALEMFLEAENGWSTRCVITANALKDAEPVVEGMAEHVYLGLVPIDKLSIHPNLLCGLHRLSCSRSPVPFPAC